MLGRAQVRGVKVSELVDAASARLGDANQYRTAYSRYIGTVRANAPAGRRYRKPLAAAHAKTQKANQPVSLFQLVA